MVICTLTAASWYAATNEILGPGFAGIALQQLQEQLRQFVLSRFKKRMPVWKSTSPG